MHAVVRRRLTPQALSLVDLIFMHPPLTPKYFMSREQRCEEGFSSCLRTVPQSSSGGSTLTWWPPQEEPMHRFSGLTVLCGCSSLQNQIITEGLSGKLKAPCQLALPARNESAFRLSSAQLALDNNSSKRGQRAQNWTRMQV